MKKLFILLSIIIVNYSCVFQHNDEIKKDNIVGNYFISSFAGYNSLEYKNTKTNSTFVLLMNTDSVGWNKSNILAVFNNQYFLIDTASHEIVQQYKNYTTLVFSRKDLNIEDFHLKELPQTVR